MQLGRHDAKGAIRRTLLASLASPSATVDDMVDGASQLLEQYYEAWLEEEALRLDMEHDLIELGGAQPPPPETPPGGFPARNASVLSDFVRATVESCLPDGELPPEPAFWRGQPRDEAALRALLAKWGEDGCPSNIDAHEDRLAVLAARGDSHDWCGRWARVGECDVNPGFMRLRCARSCELWEAHGRELLPVDALLNAANAREQMVTCATAQIELQAASLRGATQAERNSKAAFADELRNRTCASTQPMSGFKVPKRRALNNDTVYVDEDGRTIGVKFLFHTSRGLPAANISLLKNFATEDECRVALETAAPRLSPATVQGEDNPASLSRARRAQAAQLGPAKVDDPDDLVAKLWRRSFDAANTLTGYDLDPNGQEPFSVICYNGSRSESAGLPDEYRPHCDGGCDGGPHLHGGRVATMLVYCAVPDQGGATTFDHARVLAAPDPTDAVFFSYYDKDTNAMDAG